MEHIGRSINDVEFKIENGKPVIFKDFKIPRESEEFYVSVLEKYLETMGKEDIATHLTYCFRELLGNAKKANTKRVFFLDEGLNINDPGHYNKGMGHFKEKTMSNIDYYLDLQEEKNFYVQIYFHIKDPFFNIIISNNAPLLDVERDKITDKISKAKRYTSVDDAFKNILDDSEGAGLGIVILILMLRKIGLKDKNFAIAVKDDVTHVRVAVPLSLVSEEDADIISETLIKEIDSIPQFPKHINELTTMLNDSEVDFHKIAAIIKRDPALTMDILKMANSAHYRRRNKIEKIELATTILGVKGLRYLLQSYGAKKALSEKYNSNDLENMWIHSTEIANIASIVCDKCNLTELGEFTYIGGLLHDIGRIVLRSLHPSTIDKITDMCLRKNISINVVEGLLEGTNHAVIGAKMCIKWELPEKIVEIVRYHDTPYSASDELIEVSKIIYLAHMISDHLHDIGEHFDYAENVLEDMELDSEESFQELMTYVKNNLSDRMI